MNYREPMTIDGSVALSIQGTLTVTLEDGREVTLEIHPLDLDTRNRSNQGGVSFGVEYPEARDRPLDDFPRTVKIFDQGPPYVTLGGRLRGVGDELYTIRIPKTEEAS